LDAAGPGDWSVDRKLQYYSLVRSGSGEAAAAARVGVTMAAVRFERHRDPYFDRACRSALAIRREVGSHDLYQFAFGGHLPRRGRVPPGR
jgi:hypothetical protein